MSHSVAACGVEDCALCRALRDAFALDRPMAPREDMPRPSFVDVYMGLAESLARRSTCQRVGSNGQRYPVGCVITSNDYAKVYGVGYNGNAHGLPNGCDDKDAVGACGCLHAELNAALKCGRTDDRKIVFVTHSPCAMCAKALLQITNVELVYYKHPYRITTGIDILRSQGIRVGQLTP